MEGESSPVRRIRVLWVVKGLGPGGAEALLVSTAHVADTSRFHFEVAFMRPDKQHLVAALADAGVTSHLLGGPPGGSVLWPVRLRSLIAHGGYDIVHVHSPLPAGVSRLATRSIRPVARPAVLSTEHNRWGSHSRPTRVFNAATARLDDHRWSVSDQVRDSMSRSVAKGTEVLVHGIDLDSFAPAADARVRVRAELGIPRDAIVATTIANLRRVKDYPNLLRATRIAVDEVPGLYVLSVGQGPLEAELRALHAQLGLGDRMRFLGYRADTADILAASDVFVMSSEHEGYPLALMEGLAVGVPAVATSVGGVPDAISSGREGYIVPPGDSAALAAALIKIAQDPDRRARMAEAALAASTQFDIRRAVERQCDVYREVVARRRARTSAA